MTRHTIPDAALDKHVVIFGMTGAGKTSVIKTAIIEPDLEADRRVLIVTPKDDYWGLRLSKTGKGKGFDIPIFGGWHGDYPLTVKDAALLADTYATMKGSAIFCTSRLSVQDRARWFSAFAERLLSSNRGWVRVVIDEAHVFMPKQGGKGGGAIPAALHAGNELVSQGRSLGLRIVLASQRSAKLHNDASTQCSCLMAMLLMAPHDRDAVKDWIEDQADPVKGKEIIASLATLKPGEAWVWAPGAKLLDRVQFPRPATFDSSSAPDDDEGDGPQLAPINLDALKGKLATVEAEKKANDPKELKAANAILAREVAELKRAASVAPAADPVATREAIAAAEKKGFDRALPAATKVAQKLIAETLSNVRGVINGALDVAITVARKADLDIQAPVSAPMPRLPPSVPRQASEPAKAAAPRINGGATETLERPLQRIVDSIRWWNVMGIAVPKQPQVSFVAGYSHKSGTWSTYLSRLRSMQLIEGSGALRLTSEGAAYANEPDATPTGEILRQAVIAKLDAPLVRIISPIIAAYPEGLSQEEAGEKAGYSPTSGTWSTYLSRLRSLELIDGSRELKAQEWLFP